MDTGQAQTGVVWTLQLQKSYFVNLVFHPRINCIERIKNCKIFNIKQILKIFDSLLCDNRHTLDYQQTWRHILAQHRRNPDTGFFSTVISPKIPKHIIKIFEFNFLGNYGSESKFYLLF
jgi:hypothetical protein